MNRNARIAWWAVRQYPRQLLRIAFFAARHREAALAQWRGARLAETVWQAKTDPNVQTEAGLAVSAISQAARRVGEIGLVGALADKTVTDQLRRASTHAANAVSAASEPAPQRRSSLTRSGAIAIGVGVLAGAIYVAAKWYSRPQ